MALARSILCLLLLAAAKPALRPEQVMDRIEAAVRMPPAARPLQDYARFYWPAENGQVGGLYMITARSPFPDGTCRRRVAPNTNDFRACSRAEKKDNDKAYAQKVASWVGPGQRRWSDQPPLFPTFDGSGCQFVAIRYVIATGRVSARCSNDLTATETVP